jgi:hypothetical protein
LSRPPSSPSAAPELSALLGELLEKYHLLIALHAGEPGRTVARRDALREVAKRFPGALREWDQLSPSALSARRERVAGLIAALGAEDGAQRLTLAKLEPWLRYSLELHGCLRALLVERQSQTTQRGRRLSDEAYEQIAVRHGVTANVVKQAIFGRDEKATEEGEAEGEAAARD